MWVVSTPLCPLCTLSCKVRYPVVRAGDRGNPCFSFVTQVELLPHSQLMDGQEEDKAQT